MNAGTVSGFDLDCGYRVGRTGVYALHVYPSGPLSGGR